MAKHIHLCKLILFYIYIIFFYLSVEGGHNSSVGEFTNPLYFSNSSYGGYSKLTSAERQVLFFFLSNYINIL